MPSILSSLSYFDILAEAALVTIACRLDGGTCDDAYL
jgi:hypothetical protein